MQFGSFRKYFAGTIWFLKIFPLRCLCLGSAVILKLFFSMMYISCNKEHWWCIFDQTCLYPVGYQSAWMKRLHKRHIWSTLPIILYIFLSFTWRTTDWVLQSYVFSTLGMDRRNGNVREVYWQQSSLDSWCGGILCFKQQGYLKLESEQLLWYTGHRFCPKSSGIRDWFCNGTCLSWYLVCWFLSFLFSVLSMWILLCWS